MAIESGRISIASLSHPDGTWDYSFQWEGGDYVEFSREFFDYVDPQHFDSRGEYPRLEAGWEFKIGPFWLRVLGSNWEHDTITAKWLSGDRTPREGLYSNEHQLKGA